VTNNGTSIVMNIPSTFTTGTLTVQAVNSCGGTSTRSASLTRLPATPASITGPASVCPNQVGVNFTTPVVTGVTQLWTVPTGAVITAGSNTTSMTCTWGSVAGSVTVKNVNSCGSSAAASKSVTLLTCMEEQEGGPQAERIAQLDVYPNPNQGSFTIRSTQSGYYRLLNGTGQLIEEIKLNDSNNFSFEVNGLSTGFYFLQGVTGSEYVMQKVIVANR
ncbi:MAG: T9SS type A sorting domain-containing protein, partial [Flavobacteriales bacterium]